MDKVKALALGFLGALLLVVLYQAYLDHHRIMKTCDNVEAATAGKLKCW